MYSIQVGTGNLITGWWTQSNFKNCGNSTFAGSYLVRHTGYFNGSYKVDVSYMYFDGKGKRTEIGNIQPGGRYSFTTDYVGTNECWFKSYDRYGALMIGMANLFGFDLMFPATNTWGTATK
jgi:hypothetical protein